MRFEELRWTPWSEEHISRHAVRPEEVEEVLFDPPRWVASGRGGATLVYGRTSVGRRLLVVVVHEGDGMVFVVTAREMTKSEKRTFDRKAQ